MEKGYYASTDNLFLRLKKRVAIHNKNGKGLLLWWAGKRAMNSSSRNPQ